MSGLFSRARSLLLLPPSLPLVELVGLTAFWASSSTSWTEILSSRDMDSYVRGMVRRMLTVLSVVRILFIFATLASSVFCAIDVDDGAAATADIARIEATAEGEAEARRERAERASIVAGRERGGKGGGREEGDAGLGAAS